MDIVPQNPIERHQEIKNSLLQAEALKAEEIITRPNIFPAEDYSQSPNHNILPPVDHSQIIPSPNKQGANQQSKFKWLEQKSKALMVVASLILTMAFQAGLSPSGAVWQDDLTSDSSGKSARNPHRAGESIMAYRHRRYYTFFLRCNNTAFVSSLGLILMLISGLPFKHEIFMWILVVIMWLTATSIALTYGISIAFITPGMDKDHLGHVIEVAVAVWCGVMTLILLGKIAYSLHKWWKGGSSIWRPTRNGNSSLQNRGNQLRRSSTSFV